MKADLACPRCNKIKRLPDMSHAPRTWQEVHFPGNVGILICRTCKREIQLKYKAEKEAIDEAAKAAQGPAEGV